MFAGPPKPPFLLLRSRLDSPLLINGALLRHDAPFMFIGCSPNCLATFTDRSEREKQAPLSPLRTDHRTATPVICVSAGTFTPVTRTEVSTQQQKQQQKRTVAALSASLLFMAPRGSAQD
ncbi:hypothetical protein NQZ68_008616%2C partial [Xyrichtys novacula]|uniref:Uncharacterized protein n=1 Tax=Xyrichtys novacula TaxID=13765 RepID=A0AAV1G5J0_XYRNO|nr:hypothetical protein NQZ68_008616%2C partial [Xyrichtys novacula]